MHSLWTEGIRPVQGRELRGDIRTEVCVIGGGMTGVLCAARLTACGIDNVLLEAGQPGGGITAKTTAVLTAQHDQLYRTLVKRYGLARAGQYLQANLRALSRIRRMAESIDCELETCPSVMYSLTGKDKLREETEIVRRLGFPAEYTTDPGLPFPVADAVVYPDMAQFHPLKFLNGVAAGLRLYTGAFVRRLEGTTAVTDHGRVIAGKVIVATHFPFINRRGLYFVKQHQQRSYVIVYERVPPLRCTAADAGEGLYFRRYRDRMLIGGGDHRTGTCSGGFAAVEAFARRYFPQAREVCRWANQDCVTLDGVPYIGPYSPAMPDVYVATGFNLWGMTTAMVAADILCDRIRGRENPYEPVFAPDRSLLHPQLFGNLGVTAAGLLCPIPRRCPHLGCVLRYNAAEHSWDCPCHGSRFAEDGTLMDNPAMRDAHV